MIVEYCTESIADAIIAEQKGATRIEICADLKVGGLTPKKVIVKQLVESINIPVRVILRPSDSFYLTNSDLNLIKESISSFSDLDFDGFVFGYLTQDSNIDHVAISKIIQLAPTRSWTFHKAIDETPDILTAVQELEIYPEIDAILSSGGKKNAKDGLENLEKMQSMSSKVIIPGGSVTWNNSHLFMEKGLFSAVHGRKIVKI